MRADERILEEQKRHKELLARVEREAILQNENCQIKIRTIEIEAKALKEEVKFKDSIDGECNFIIFFCRQC